MRIAVWHNLPSGGGKRALYDHVKGLVARGHYVESWCPPTADQTYLPLGELVKEHVVDLEVPRHGYWADRWQVTLEMDRRIASMDEHCRVCALQMAQAGFDILFANSCLLFRTTSIGRQASLPSVLYLQEPYRWLYEAMPRFRWVAQPKPTKPLTKTSLKAAFIDIREIRNARVQAREERNNAAAFDVILANSHFSRESILRAYGLDSQVCYLGIDTEHFHDKGLPRKKFIVGLGAFTPEKNAKLVIEALALIDAPRPELVWIGNVAGPGYMAELSQLAASKGVEFRPLLGIADSEIVEWLNTATAMIYCPRLEPFGLAPLEANACGTPVIAVPEGGVRETIINDLNGLMVKNSPVAVAAAIDRLMTDPDLARRLGTAGRKAVEAKWGLTDAITRLEDRLQDVAVTSRQRVPTTGDNIAVADGRRYSVIAH